MGVWQSCSLVPLQRGLQTPGCCGPRPRVPTLARPPGREQRAAPALLPKIPRLWGSPARLATAAAFFLSSSINPAPLHTSHWVRTFPIPQLFYTVNKQRIHLTWQTKGGNGSLK